MFFILNKTNQIRTFRHIEYINYAYNNGITWNNTHIINQPLSQKLKGISRWVYLRQRTKFSVMFLYWIKQCEQKEKVCYPVKVQGHRGWWAAEEHNSPTGVGNKPFLITSSPWHKGRWLSWFSVRHIFALWLSHSYSKCSLEGSRSHTTKLCRQHLQRFEVLSQIRLSKLLLSRISVYVSLSQTAVWVLIIHVPCLMPNSIYYP